MYESTLHQTAKEYMNLFYGRETKVILTQRIQKMWNMLGLLKKDKINNIYKTFYNFFSFNTTIFGKEVT